MRDAADEHAEDCGCDSCRYLRMMSVTPGEHCMLCAPVSVAPEDRPEGVHDECATREVLGGIGHLTDHAYWCDVMHDPDAGLSYRESALAVYRLVRSDEWRARR